MYQEIFNQIYTSLDEETYGRYGRLVRSLEETFKAAGHTITATELAGRWHNYICGCIGLIDIAEIAKGFIGWASEPPRIPWQLEEVMAGGIKYFYSKPGLPVGTIAGYQSQIDNYLRQNGIRRKSKKYDAFIKEKAAQTGAAMRRDAATALERHKTAQAEYLKGEKELDAEAIQYADTLDRLLEVIAAFEVIGGLEVKETAGKADLKEISEKLRAGAAQREAVMVEWETREYDLDNLISELISHNPDLLALWQESLEAGHAK